MRTWAFALASAALLSGCGAPAPKYLTAPPPATPLNTSSEEAATRTRARAHTELAAGYYELRNMAVALDEIKLALKAEPEYGPAYNVAGLIYAELREDRLAQENFNRALRINPQDSDANNNYGRFLCDRKREGEALKYFQTAISNPLYQTPERAYVNAGMCLRRRGDANAAQDYFLRALAIQPRDAQALYQLADMLFARQRYDEARQYLIRLEKLASPTAETLWLAVRIERQTGDPNAEASYGRQLNRLFPDSKEARAYLAGVRE